MSASRGRGLGLTLCRGELLEAVYCSAVLYGVLDLCVLGGPSSLAKWRDCQLSYEILVQIC